MRVFALLCLALAAAEAGLPMESRCGDTLCDKVQYCSDFDRQCRNCSDVCLESSHNYEQRTCESKCQYYIHDVRYMNLRSTENRSLAGAPHCPSSPLAWGLLASSVPFLVLGSDQTTFARDSGLSEKVNSICTEFPGIASARMATSVPTRMGKAGTNRLPLPGKRESPEIPESLRGLPPPRSSGPPTSSGTEGPSPFIPAYPRFRIRPTDQTAHATDPRRRTDKYRVHIPPPPYRNHPDLAQKVDLIVALLVVVAVLQTIMILAGFAYVLKARVPRWKTKLLHSIVKGKTVKVRARNGEKVERDRSRNGNSASRCPEP
ncbi:unnamed protein product [Darwinula stevensoni]|uniref:TNFR-Cys domain-containing protein n=1 Tax=Darwinula stevensoni TaxID=69355 RepID=A0A7R8X5Z6_9CRUS|nr:unnamed protein product [Darwinula stevensoni]CAG0880679.1 unnamed protein product [Darwinula stevensoni]